MNVLLYQCWKTQIFKFSPTMKQRVSYGHWYRNYIMKLVSYLLLFLKFRDDGVSGSEDSNCPVSLFLTGLSVLSVFFLRVWYTLSEILFIVTFSTFFSAVVTDLGEGLPSRVENETLLLSCRGSVQLRWLSPCFFWGVSIDFKAVDFLLWTLETSDDVVDIKDIESSSSSSINMDATSCAFIRRPKHWPVDLRLSVK